MPILKREREWPKAVRVTATLESVRKESARMSTARFKVPPETPVHVPGQYALLDREIDGNKQTRPFTIASSPNLKGVLEFSTLLKEEGALTPWLHHGLKPGDTISLRTPIGKFTYSHEEFDPEVHLVFLHGGSGVTPGLCVCRMLYEERAKTDIDFFFANRTEQDIPFRGELEEMAKEWEPFDLYLSVDTPSAGWTGHSGFMDGRWIAENVKHPLPDCLIYLCGPPTMMESLSKQLAEDHGVPTGQILTESFF